MLDLLTLFFFASWRLHLSLNERLVINVSIFISHFTLIIYGWLRVDTGRSMKLVHARTFQCRLVFITRRLRLCACNVLGWNLRWVRPLVSKHRPEVCEGCFGFSDVGRVVRDCGDWVAFVVEWTTTENHELSSGCPCHHHRCAVFQWLCSACLLAFFVSGCGVNAWSVLFLLNWKNFLRSVETAAGELEPSGSVTPQS